ncbi:hypothetical protein EV401DRAFT_1955252 [Pisolithus croceorrhizus]|nr:hypothetical protein EV401DRAFT_1955252 [Pisolithus croceorrhizus]
MVTSVARERFVLLLVGLQSLRLVKSHRRLAGAYTVTGSSVSAPFLPNSDHRLDTNTRMRCLGLLATSTALSRMVV